MTRYKIYTQKYGIEESHTIEKMLEGDTYTVKKSILWRNGDIYVELSDEEKQELLNKSDGGINQYDIELEALYGSTDGDTNIYKNDEEIHDGTTHDTISDLVYEEGMDNMEDDFDWDFIDREYTIHGTIELEEV